jgi:hypothetical protein
MVVSFHQTQIVDEVAQQNQQTAGYRTQRDASNIQPTYSTKLEHNAAMRCRQVTQARMHPNIDRVQEW